MWEPRPLTPLWVFTTCYSDNFTFLLFTFYCLSSVLYSSQIVVLRIAWVELSFMLRPTVSRPVSLGIKYPFGAYDQIFITCVTFTVLFLWGALSDQRTGLSFIHAAGPCQRNLSLVRVPWDLRPYFTVSDLRLPFSSPPTTRRVTVEVFDPAFRFACSGMWFKYWRFWLLGIVLPFT
jgi:hypothetical protein